MEPVAQHAEIIGLIVAALALGVGIWHVVSLGKQIEHTRRIAESVSTRYIGQFPRAEFLSAITTSLTTAKNDIAVLCDFPAYGAFASPTEFLEYRHMLETKAQDGVRVRVVHYDKSRREAAYREFFDKGPIPWPAWRDSHHKMVDTYLLRKTGKRRHKENESGI